MPRVVAARPAVGEPASLQGLRCLIVDDNETNRKILEYQTTSWGMRNVSAATGYSALAQLRTSFHRGEPFDVAILDMHMPEMDGIQLARAIKADPALAPMKLVMLASISPKEHGHDISDVDIAAYLTKPVKQSHLYNCLVGVMAEQKAEPVHDATPAAIEPAERVQRGRILVVEDNPVNQKVAVRMVEKCGFRADVAANGIEAVDAVEQMPYDLVFMDCQMPEMDGYQATIEIRRREAEGTAARHIPIIAMTAHALAGDDQKCFAAGMDDYISKPVKPNQLRALLDRVLPGVAAAQ
jgi:CheY-like chemotaxis protein